MAPKKDEPLREILPKSGLVYSEKSTLIEILCKPRIMPIKSQTLLRLEQMEKELAAKTKPLPFRGNAPPGSSYGNGRPLEGSESHVGFSGFGSVADDRPVSSAGARSQRL